MVGRSLNQIDIATLHRPFGQHRRVEHYRCQLFHKLLDGLPFTQRQHRRFHLLHAVPEKVSRETRHKFIFRIMMMDTVGKPNPLQISFQRFELRLIAVSLIHYINSFQCPPDRQVIAAILIVQDVTPHQCSFRQMVKQHFLLQ